MLKVRIPIILSLLALFFSTKAAPLGLGELTPEQNEILEDRITKLTTIKFYDRDLDTLTLEDVMAAVTEAYDNEIAAIEKEKNIRLEDLNIDLTPYRAEMEEELKKQGYDESVVNQSFKIVEMLVLYFHDHDYSSLRGDEYFNEVVNALDKEIARLERQIL